MAAGRLSIGAGGALSLFETVVLLTVEETMDALRRARQIRYRPPGSGVSVLAPSRRHMRVRM